MVEQSEAKMGVSNNATYPALAPEPLTVIVFPVRLAQLWKYAGFIPPAMTGTFPRDGVFFSNQLTFFDFDHIAQPLRRPLAAKTGQPFFAGEELLHGGLFEVALLGDEPLQPANQIIRIAQRGCDGALFGRKRHSDGNGIDEIAV